MPASSGLAEGIVTLVEHAGMTIPGAPAARGEARAQFAALCYKIAKGKPQFLLITSRRTKRWIVPKGWPMTDRDGAGCALQEAFEEAGVVGEVCGRACGTFRYMKLLDDGAEVPCAVQVFPVRVRSLKSRYPEHSQRRRKWFGRKKAAKKVDDADLARLIRDFAPPGKAGGWVGPA